MNVFVGMARSSFGQVPSQPIASSSSPTVVLWPGEKQVNINEDCRVTGCHDDGSKVVNA